MANIIAGQHVRYFDETGRDSPALVLKVHDKRIAEKEVLDLATFEGDVKNIPHREACIKEVEVENPRPRNDTREWPRKGESATRIERKRTPGLAFWHE